MKLYSSYKPIVGVILACLLASFTPLCRAESQAHIAKHARKVEKRLARTPEGTYLHLVFRDHAETLGSLGALSASSFAFTNADTNATQTYSYADVARVEKGDAYIGEGSVRRHHFRLLIPAAIVVGGAAVAAAVVLAAR
ncbi:MAG: hypothetical protein ACRD27_07515 [Terracidiphilus sp.]